MQSDLDPVSDGGLTASRLPASAGPNQLPRLIVFYSQRSGRCRRVDGFIAQVLQWRRNHERFRLVRVSVDERPDLAQRFRIDDLPTLVVVEGHEIRRRIVSPRNCTTLQRELAPWLRNRA